MCSLKVSITDKEERTGLHIAASHGRHNMVALMMGQGAELGAKDKVGYQFSRFFLSLIMFIQLNYEQLSLYLIYTKCN